MVADNLEDELLARLRAAEILCDEIEGETLGLSRFVTDRTREDAALLADDALEPVPEETNIQEEAEDTLEKFKAARKRVEDELGIGDNFDENELKYEVMLEKLKLIAGERSEEIATLLQTMLKNDSGFNTNKDF